MNVVAPEAEASWSLLSRRLAAEADPAKRRQLEVVATHIHAEVAGDLDVLMGTLTPDPQYRFWGHSHIDEGPKGAEAVLAHYQGLTRTGKNRLEFAVDRVAVDTDLVVTEGTFRHAVGMPAEQRSGDGPTWHLEEYDALVLWVFEPGAGLLRGEDVYLQGEVRRLRRLTPGELPHLGPAGRAG